MYYNGLMIASWLIATYAVALSTSRGIVCAGRSKLVSGYGEATRVGESKKSLTV